MKNLPIILASTFISLLTIGYIIYVFNITKNKPTEAVVKDYIENSDTLVLKDIKILKTELETYSHPFGFYTKTRKRRTALIKATNYNKYFSLEIYDTRRSINVKSIQKENNVYVIVNKTDFNNPKFGTENSPLSILLFYTEKEYMNYYVSEEMYFLAVKEYLTYIRDR